LLNQLGEMLEPVYGFRSLHQFKTKFKPRYEPTYMIFTDEAALPRIGVALTQAFLPGRLRDYASVLRS
ncbi:MAG: phosphatidylglycerol lysyltransferase domain-containing protein, partial [Lapillicoccus sp.]